MNPGLQQVLNGIRRAPSLYACLTIFLVLSIANYFLWQQQKVITKQYDDVRRTGESMFSALSSHPRLLSQLAAVESALKQIDENLVTEDLADNQGYFYQLETLSRVRLTQLNQLSPQPTDDSPYRTIPFSLRVTGTYPQVISFLRVLESGPRLAQIKSFDFDRGEAKNNLIALGLTVELLATP